MPWPLAYDYLKAITRLERERLLAVTIAIRAVQADEKGWKRWVERLSA